MNKQISEKHCHKANPRRWREIINIKEINGLNLTFGLLKNLRGVISNNSHDSADLGFLF